MPGLAERIEDIEPNLEFELERWSREQRQRVAFNREARERYLRFAASPEAAWSGNFRDLGASVMRMATLAHAGRIGLDVAVEPGSGGRRLRLTLKNKSESDLTVILSAGALSIPASEPIGVLKVVVSKASRVPVAAGGAAAPLVVDQQPGRGVLDGTCELSVYEGTPLFSGSVTRGTVPR